MFFSLFILLSSSLASSKLYLVTVTSGQVQKLYAGRMFLGSVGDSEMISFGSCGEEITFVSTSLNHISGFVDEINKKSNKA